MKKISSTWFLYIRKSNKYTEKINIGTKQTKIIRNYKMFAILVKCYSSAVESVFHQTAFNSWMESYSVAEWNGNNQLWGLIQANLWSTPWLPLNKSVADSL